MYYVLPCEGYEKELEPNDQLLDYRKAVLKSHDIVPWISDTVNTLFGTNIQTEEEMEGWLDQRRPKETIKTEFLNFQILIIFNNIFGSVTIWETHNWLHYFKMQYCIRIIELI